MKPLRDLNTSVQDEIDTLQANAAEEPEEEPFTWTILLTVPTGLLRWRPQPFRLDAIPDEQDTLDLADARQAQSEEWQRQSAHAKEAAQWTMRLCHLGLLRRRFPWLPIASPCSCALCTHREPFPENWRPCGSDVSDLKSL